MGKVLTKQQLEHYESNGFVCPVDCFTRKQAEGYLAQLEDFERSSGTKLSKGYNFKPHLLFKWVDEIARNKTVLDAVEDIIGPDIRLFHLSVWPKDPHEDVFVSWHQDATYFGLQPSTQVTVWVALSDAPVEAGCMEVVPGSQVVGQLHHGEDHTNTILLSKGQTIDVPFDHEQTQFMPVSAGQFSIHDTFLIHRSGPNRSNHRRVGLGFSYIPANSRVDSDIRLTAALVRGRDDVGYFEDEPRPETDNGPRERAFHEEAVKRFRAANNQQAAKF